MCPNGKMVVPAEVAESLEIDRDKLRQQIELLLQIREHDKAKVESDSIVASHQMKMNYFIESHLTGQTGENREWRTFKTGSLAELQAWLDQRKERPYGPKQPYRLVDKDGKVIDATA